MSCSKDLTKTVEYDDDMPPLLQEEQPQPENLNSAKVDVNTVNAENSDDDNYDDVIDDENDDGDDDDDEADIGEEPTNCLFCTHVSNGVDLAIAHLRSEHQLDLVQLKEKHSMDQYSFIKLINCIRTESTRTAAQVAAAEQPLFWADDKYLKPVQYEPWLSYDYDQLQTKNETMDVLALQEQVRHQLVLLQQAEEDKKKMREAFDRLIAKETLSNETKSKNGPINGVKLQKDTEYFSSYAHWGIHHEMLSDVVRTTSYRDALLLNKAYVQGKTVLDVGCGTSVLSIFAARAGASKVVGIDNSEIVYNAMSILKHNKIDNITLLKGRLEETELPIEKYDIIISEWMGYFLLFEGMLDSIIYARQRHLKEGGIILPNRCTMSLLGYGSDALYARQLDFWNDVYGVDMSVMREEVLHEPLVEIVDATHILTESEIIADLDMATAELNYTNFTHHFNLKCTKAGNLSAFVGFFDTFFDLPERVHFGTAPTDTPTHWKQVVFFLDAPRVLQPGDIVSGKISCKRLKGNQRSLHINIELEDGKRFTYYLD